MFSALTGETVGQMSRRLRLERASIQLSTSDASISVIAVVAGYASVEAFSKSFRADYGLTPSEFRTGFALGAWLPTPNGVHVNHLRPEEFLRIDRTSGETMNIETREFHAREALCLRHKGPYNLIGTTFGRVSGIFFRSGAGIPGPAVGFYYDDPGAVAPEDLRSHAGILVPDGFASPSEELERVPIEAGRYVVGAYVGPYDGIAAAWGDFMRTIAENGLALADSPCFEVYINDPMTTPAPELITELCGRLA